jgi:hypothetical protein
MKIWDWRQFELERDLRLVREKAPYFEALTYGVAYIGVNCWLAWFAYRIYQFRRLV